MAAIDLTTLGAVKLWLDITSDKSDRLLSSLVTSVSSQVLAILSRSVMYSHSVTETRSGTGNSGLLLREFPVTSVESVRIGGAVIPQSQTDDAGGQSYGWSLSDYSGTPPGSNQVLTIVGGVFDVGQSNVVVQYTAGYRIDGELLTVPASLEWQVLAPLGTWSAPVSAAYADSGAALTLVSSSPAAGQYAVAPVSVSSPTPGLMQFAAADVGRSVLLSYSYMPAALEQVVIELVAERFRYKDRVGLRSKALAGQETVSFDLSGVPAYQKAILNQWASVVLL